MRTLSTSAAISVTRLDQRSDAANNALRSSQKIIEKQVFDVESPKDICMQVTNRSELLSQSCEIIASTPVYSKSTDVNSSAHAQYIPDLSLLAQAEVQIIDCASLFFPISNALYLSPHDFPTFLYSASLLPAASRLNSIDAPQSPSLRDLSESLVLSNYTESDPNSEYALATYSMPDTERMNCITFKENYVNIRWVAIWERNSKYVNSVRSCIDPGGGGIFIQVVRSEDLLEIAISSDETGEVLFSLDFSQHVVDFRIIVERVNVLKYIISKLSEVNIN